MDGIMGKLKELESRINAIENHLKEERKEIIDDGWTKCGEGIIYLDVPEDIVSNRDSDSERKWPHNRFA